MTSTSSITTHVLDTSHGRPASGVPVVLEVIGPRDQWQEIGRGVTDADGRLRTLMPASVALTAGVYRLVFDTRSYFQSLRTRSFYPQVTVVFEVADENAHYHVPLLLSPFGYSTYRGS
jgi:5-hydroxyisourate hydrolase